MKDTNAILPRIVDSVLGTVPVVGSGMQNVYDTWRQKNINTAREVLLSNIRQGDVEQMHQDQFFSMLARFSRSVHEDVAKSNLVLLARLITGIGYADKEKGKAETFNRYANMLENLTWAEIVFLSRCIKSGEVIPGSAEIKQILHQKGFFVQSFDTTVSGKSADVQQSPDSQQYGPCLGDAYRHMNLGGAIRNPYTIPDFNTMSWDSFGAQERHDKDKNVPYQVDIDIKYEFSSRFYAFLQKYGNLWEDISKWNATQDTSNE